MHLNNPRNSFLDNDHVSLVFIPSAGISLPRQLQGRYIEVRTMMYSAVLAERCALFVRQPRGGNTIGQPGKKMRSVVCDLHQVVYRGEQRPTIEQRGAMVLLRSDDGVPSSLQDLSLSCWSGSCLSCCKFWMHKKCYFTYWTCPGFNHSCLETICKDMRFYQFYMLSIAN